MTTRLIVPAEADEKMMMAGIDSAYLMASASEGDATIACYAAMLAASPASGKVTEGEVEKAARAAFNSLPWEEYSNFDRRNYIYMIKRALASLGLEMENPGSGTELTS